ncbi:hypothetical protein [Fodinicola acaciae]|uniref:hypothetical protein n=1 Tax=Fodinicola acaciae TaxID=2681555 RepID=UPI0013D44D54|nr:hypothetical protein [Fodinicola acaciae]
MDDEDLCYQVAWDGLRLPGRGATNHTGLATAHLVVASLPLGLCGHPTLVATPQVEWHDVPTRFRCADCRQLAPKSPRRQAA